MQNFELLGAFYLGKTLERPGGAPAEQPLLYDARDLTTHAVCVGMTGSGKTGLCIDLLEEAAIDRVPALIIDPKGDITNLLLTFPELKAEDFLPWINLDDARQRQMTPEAFAAAQAASWQTGLAEWGQSAARIQLLRQSAEFLIFTPGSDAGLPVSILHSLQKPALSWEDNAEALRDQISGTVSALLGLIGVDADPVRSREHILLATIFEAFWRQERDLDLALLIGAIQNPPFRTLGVADVDIFYPHKDRFNLAMAFNGLVAAPSFQSWLAGRPLDIGQLLYADDGRPRHVIFYIAHLSDGERMFFVTLLLEQILAWTRAQAGTTSLRALVYMDELFGYFPPVGEPPSKRPLLTLLKQARAFGVGLVLTTQNPVDLDYKGLTNAGTWFVGKLQAQRDKDRLLDGLEGAAAGSPGTFDRAALDKTISALGPREFLLHNVHDGAPRLFKTRWALSYLRGPLTRTQVRTLMAGYRAEEEDSQAAAPGAPPQAAPRPVTPQAAPGRGAARPRAAASKATINALSSSAGLAAVPPALPPEVRQAFLPLQVGAEGVRRRLQRQAGAQLDFARTGLVYEPALLGLASVHFVDRRRGVDQAQEVSLLLPLDDGASLVRWQDAQPVAVQPDSLQERPEAEAAFAALPALASSARAVKGLAGDLADYLYRAQAVSLWHNPTLKLYATAGEKRRDFIIRCQQAAREARDEEVDALSRKYQARIERLQERLLREQKQLAQDEAEVAMRNRETWVSMGESVLGLFLHSRRTRVASVALSKHRLAERARLDVEEGRQSVAELEQTIAQLQAANQREVEAITSKWVETLDDVQEIKITPRRADVDVRLVALAWRPAWNIEYVDLAGRTRQVRVAAWDEGE